MKIKLNIDIVWGKHYKAGEVIEADAPLVETVKRKGYQFEEVKESPKQKELKPASENGK